MTNPPRPEIFLSYSMKDEGFARRLGRSLAARNITTKSGRSESRTGDTIDNVIRRAMQESDLFVLLISDASAASPWISFELGAASVAARALLLVYLSKNAQRRFSLPGIAATAHIVVDPNKPAHAADLIAAHLKRIRE